MGKHEEGEELEEENVQNPRERGKVGPTGELIQLRSSFLLLILHLFVLVLGFVVYSDLRFWKVNLYRIASIRVISSQMDVGLSFVTRDVVVAARLKF